MAEWLVEEGIGEHRAVLVENGDIVAAKVYWPGTLAAGHVEDAILVSKPAGSLRGTARFASGEEAMVDGLPRDAAEGARIRLIVTRAAILELRRAKLAQARPCTAPVQSAPTLAQQLQARIVTGFDGWDELWTEAIQGVVEFTGGSLTFEPTTAMTTIDVDGILPPLSLALAAIEPLARAIRRFDLGGSIVVDFPTLEDKADRKAVDAALATALTAVPHERTAMNGFGLVQLVLRREGPSLIDRLRGWPEAAARLLLRRAERVADPGPLLLTAPARVRASMQDAWLDQLARRTGREIRWQIDDGLAPWGCFAQSVAA